MILLVNVWFDLTITGAQHGAKSKSPLFNIQIKTVEKTADLIMTLHLTVHVNIFYMKSEAPFLKRKVD